MTPERWQRICALFDRVRPCEPEGRDALLREACGDDPDLRAEVERLRPPAGRAGHRRRAGRESRIVGLS